jgi:hypothetical protein
MLLFRDMCMDMVAVAEVLTSQSNNQATSP